MINDTKLLKYGVTAEEYRKATSEGLKWCTRHKKFEPKEKFSNPKSGNPCILGLHERYVGISKTPQERRKNSLKNRHKMTEQQYHQKFEEQGRHCALCQSTKTNKGTPLAVDHNHECCKGRNTCGKCTRGLLCDPCNFKLGQLERLLKEALVMPFSTLIGTPESWTGRAMRYLGSYKKIAPTQA